MKRPDYWCRLAKIARSIPTEAISEPAPGFSTRVAALAMDARHQRIDLLGAMALRALGIAVALVFVACLLQIPNLNRPDNRADEPDDTSSELVAAL
jgi:hypothetical protein